MTELTTWRLRCPQCGGGDIRADSAVAACHHCPAKFERRDGIWRFLKGPRLEYFEGFLRNYTRVRIAEGRADYDDTLLRQLPNCPGGHSLAHQWRIRAKSFQALLRLLRREVRHGGRILDLGAGSGWLSNRLDEAGFSPCAVDLSDDRNDGLGASTAYAGAWPRIQSEFDHLPFADQVADAVVFNASFHYCENQSVTLQEATRVLRSRGILIIVDSPIYSDISSGEKMLEEQQVYFERLIGERSDAITASGFLTWEAMQAFQKSHNLHWHYLRPWYGLRWAARPCLAAIRQLRQPADFVIAWTYKPSNPVTA